MSLKKIIAFAGCIGLTAFLSSCAPKPLIVPATKPAADLEQKVEQAVVQPKSSFSQQEYDEMKNYFDNATDVFTGKYDGKKGHQYVFIGNWYHKEQEMVRYHDAMYFQESKGETKEMPVAVISLNPSADLKLSKISHYIVFSERLATPDGNVNVMLKYYPIGGKYPDVLKSILSEYRAKK